MKYLLLFNLLTLHIFHLHVRVDATAVAPQSRPSELSALAKHTTRHLLQSSNAHRYHRHHRHRHAPLSESVVALRKLLAFDGVGYYPSDQADYIPYDMPSVLRVSTREGEEGEVNDDQGEEDSGEDEESEGEEGSEEGESETESGTSAEQTVATTAADATVPVAETTAPVVEARTPADADPVTVAKTVRKVARSKIRSKKKAKTSSGGGGGRIFRGIEGGMQDGVNITHLSYMVFKIIKQNDIRSVIDMPCRTTLNWFPELLNRIDFEVIGFKYYCVDTDEHSQDDIRGLFNEAGSPEFLHITPEESHLLPKVDLVFSWDGPQQWGVKKTWTFFTALRQIRPKFMMITNNPGVVNTNGERGLLNLRKQPFHFAQALRVISHVHEDENPKQLLFYEMDGVRRGF